MHSWTLVVLVVAIVSAVAVYRLVSTRQKRLYREKVGLDLGGLVALLPVDLQRRQYSGFMVAPGSDDAIRIGLIYDDGMARRGNPPNVGLAFDRQSGALLEIRPAGFGLGLK